MKEYLVLENIKLDLDNSNILDSQKMIVINIPYKGDPSYGNFTRITTIKKGAYISIGKYKDHYQIIYPSFGSPIKEYVDEHRDREYINMYQFKNIDNILEFVERTEEQVLIDEMNL